jgi:hypothetical protein
MLLNYDISTARFSRVILRFSRATQLAAHDLRAADPHQGLESLV